MNIPKTLNQSFEELISQRNWYVNSGIDRRKAGMVKVYYKKGKISENKIRFYLESAGYKLYQNELWTKE